MRYGSERKDKQIGARSIQSIEFAWPTDRQYYNCRIHMANLSQIVFGSFNIIKYNGENFVCKEKSGSKDLRSP